MANPRSAGAGGGRGPRAARVTAGGAGHKGYACEAAASGQAALLALRQQAWDLVLLDWGLPDFSGIEVCERLRAGGSTTPVLMLTAHDDVAERVRALDASADD
jgi:two-component system, OmpR family, response regulator MprA